MPSARAYNRGVAPRKMQPFYTIRGDGRLWRTGISPSRPRWFGWVTLHDIKITYGTSHPGALEARGSNPKAPVRRATLTTGAHL
jgi:hypothetical protein